MITAYIYKNPLFATCSNGGISERHDRVTVVNAGERSGFVHDGSPPVFLRKGPAHTVYAVPVTRVGDEWKVPLVCMFGGAFIGCSDGRFSDAVTELLGVPHYGAVALHDRIEAVLEPRVSASPPDTQRRRSFGPKHEATRGLGDTEIAKLMRADIKAAIKDGRLPQGIKVSVRTEFYSMGSSIDIRVTALPGDFALHADTYVRGETTRRDGPYTPQAESLLKVLEEIHWSYNYDNSDSMTDYFNRRYNGDASIAHELEKAKLDQARAALPADATVIPFSKVRS